MFATLIVTDYKGCGIGILSIFNTVLRYFTLLSNCTSYSTSFLAMRKQQIEITKKYEGQFKLFF